MASDEEVWNAQFEKMGVNQVRATLLEWTGPLRGAAIRWLAEKDQEASRLAEASSLEAWASNREANNIAREAAVSARAAASEARAANVLTEASNRTAADLADAQRQYNRIATAALVISAIALIVSIVSIWKK